MRENEEQRFGSSDFCSAADFAAAGMFDKQPSSIFMGYDGARPLYYNGQAGVVTTAGARAGKMRDWLAYNLLSGTCQHSVVMLDLKGEGAAISQNQTFDRKFCAYWNPIGLHGLPQDRINFVDHLRLDSPTLVSDTKVFCENLIATSGSASGAYFEGRAREVLEAFALAKVEVDGVLSLPGLYEVVMLSVTQSDAWLDFGFEMSESRFPIVRRVEAEIAESRTGGGDGWQGIMGEVFKSLACLSDPILLAAVSPPYTMSFSQLCESDQAWQVYLMPPAEFVGAWGPVIKAAFVSAMTWKARAPSAPRQTWFLDECGQIASGASSGFGLVPRMFTYGAGIGVQPVAVFQTNRQMRALGPEAEALITSSAGARLMFALRDFDSAKDCSAMLGKQTLSYDDGLQQGRARTARRAGLMQLFNGADPFATALSIAQQGREARHRSKQQRDLRTADEVMLMPSNKAVLFADGLPHPGYIDRRPFWDDPGCAGRFTPNPYHPPQKAVTIATSKGAVRKRVLMRPVPAKFAAYPQYRGGQWTFVEGFEHA